MNDTTTPRTDRAANESIVAVYKESKRLERELAEARAAMAKLHKDLGHECRDPYGTIWDECARLQRELTKALEENKKLIADMVMHERMSERFQDERDRLEEALKSVASGAVEEVNCIKIAREALAAVKGEQP